MQQVSWRRRREAFLAAAACFTEVVERAWEQPEEHERPALGEWTVRDLVGHTLRAVSTVEAYLTDELAVDGALDLDSPIDYYVHIGRHADHAEVAERGRRAGRALGADPVPAIRDAVRRVEERVRTAAPETVVATPAGRLTLAAYLPTRTCELTVHVLDLADATGTTHEIPAPALEQTAVLLVDLAARLGRLESGVRLLADRRAPRLALFGG